MHLNIHPSIEAWAHARRADVFARELEHSIDHIGPIKPMGSFGIAMHTGSNGARMLLRYYAQKLRRPRDVQCISVTPQGYSDRLAQRRLDASDVIWIYAYSVSAVEAIMAKHARTLAEAEWPCETALPFVCWHREHLVEPLTPLFDVVADMYGDRLNPGRTDVLPGFSRREMVDAMRLLYGHGDPDEHHLQSVLDI